MINMMDQVTNLFVIFVLIVLNAVMIAGVRIPLLSIFFGLFSAIIAGLITDVMLYPFLNILLIVCGIFAIYSGIMGVRE